MWIDGSFTTEKLEPDDVDLLVVLDSAQANAASLDVRRDLGALLDPVEVKARYDCHLFVEGSGDTDARSFWRGWFGFTPYPDERPKGIPRLRINS